MRNRFITRRRKGSSTTTYYVDTAAANDNGAGTSAGTAWKTLSKVGSMTFNPGDTILLKAGCTWKYESLTVPSSGTPALPITFGKYGSGANPLLDMTQEYNDWASHSGAIWKRTHVSADPFQVFEDGVRMKYSADVAGMSAGSWAYVSGVMYVWASDGGNPSTGHVTEYGDGFKGISVRLNGKSYLVFDGIDTTKENYAGYCTDLANSSNIVIKNCTGSWCGSRSWLIGADPAVARTCSDITIQNCIGHDNLDVPFWIGHGTRLYVLNCESYNNGKDVAPQPKNYPLAGGKHYPNGILVSADGIDCVVRSNYVHDIYNGAAIIDEYSLGVKSQGTIIERNKIDTTASAVYALQITGTNTIVRNNWVIGGSESIMNFANAPVTPKVYNNTFISPSGASHSIDTASQPNITIKNNIIIRAGSTNRYISVAAAAKTGFVCNRNLYFGASTGRWFWGPTEYTTLATWQAASSCDTNGQLADPKFAVANTNVHLQSSSPCIGAGESGLVTDDYDGVARGAATDIGAFEYV